MDVTWAAGSIEIPGLSVTVDPGSKDVRRAAGRAFDLTRKICTHPVFWKAFAASRRIACSHHSGTPQSWRAIGRILGTFMSSEDQRREPLESIPTACLAPLLEPARARGAGSKDRLQAQLRQSQKLEAVGMFAAGIAHDFNNILGAILGYGELVQRATPAGSVERRYIDNVMRAGGRAKSLVECILAFSRTGVADHAPINVQAVIEEALELLAASLAPGVRLETRLEGGNAAILGDATQLLRLTTNLCTNALQAMENGGVLGVTLDCMHVEQSRILSHGSLTRAPMHAYVCATPAAAFLQRYSNGCSTLTSPPNARPVEQDSVFRWSTESLRIWGARSTFAREWAGARP
jgi:hypothetical protein